MHAHSRPFNGQAKQLPTCCVCKADIGGGGADGRGVDREILRGRQGLLQLVQQQGHGWLAPGGRPGQIQLQALQAAQQYGPPGGTVLRQIPACAQIETKLSAMRLMCL